ncbi:hypothetical protein [Halobacillus seohaensis]|uniref:Uncharacterized protein n=1 Tax=Halobacillus seohaensis TaxID=447421 RepID=A0ABW2EHT3_9BACI
MSQERHNNIKALTRAVREYNIKSKEIPVMSLPLGLGQQYSNLHLLIIELEEMLNNQTFKTLNKEEYHKRIRSRLNWHETNFRGYHKMLEQKYGLYAEKINELF